MDELERLTQILGGPTATARRLRISIRTHQLYRKHGRIPKSMAELILSVLREEESKRSVPETENCPPASAS